jgi:hypothetical protein
VTLARDAWMHVCSRAMRPSFCSLVSFAVLVPLFALACEDDKKAPAGAPSASAVAPASAAPTATASSTATASAAPTSSVPPPKCPAGLTGNPVPAYCIKLPATYKVKDARIAPTRGSIAYDTGNEIDALMVSYDDTPIAQLAKDTESEMKFGQDKLEKKGDLPGGGKWFEGTHADYRRTVTLFKGPPPLSLKCSFAYKPSSAPPKEAVDACRSIVVP